MYNYLKRGKPAEAKRAEQEQIANAVRQVLREVEARGDAAINELSKKFDDWSPASFRLTPKEIEAALAEADPAESDPCPPLQILIEPSLDNLRSQAITTSIDTYDKDRSSTPITPTSAFTAPPP